MTFLKYRRTRCSTRSRSGLVMGGVLRLAIGAREHVDEDCYGGAYAVDEAALRHGAGVEEETSGAEPAYAHFPKTEPTRYRDGWLPSG